MGEKKRTGRGISAGGGNGTVFTSVDIKGELCENDGGGTADVFSSGLLFSPGSEKNERRGKESDQRISWGLQALPVLPREFDSCIDSAVGGKRRRTGFLVEGIEAIIAAVKRKTIFILAFL